MQAHHAVRRKILPPVPSYKATAATLGFNSSSKASSSSSSPEADSATESAEEYAAKDELLKVRGAPLLGRSASVQCISIEFTTSATCTNSKFS